MSEQIIVEITVPEEELEKALSLMAVERSLPIVAVPIDHAEVATLKRMGLGEERERERRALREALARLDHMEAMGFVSSSGKILDGEGSILDRVRSVLACADGDNPCAVHPEAMTKLRIACQSRLSVLDACASALRGRYVAVVRLLVPHEHLSDVDAIAENEGLLWVFKCLGVDKSSGHSSLLSKIIGRTA